MKIDLVLITTRRPELLKQTLASFSQHVFEHFSIQSVIANIDPVFGGKKAHEEVRSLITTYFPDAQLIEPREGKFCAAVKNSWLQTKSDVVLNLEEDWIALQPIYSKIIHDNLGGSVKSLSLMHSHKNWNGQQLYHYRRYRPWYLPLKIEDKSKPIFSLSPSFWNGDFLRECAKRLDTTFDPEKQFYDNLNPQLENFVQDSKCKFIIGNPNLVEDIGRQWQQDNNIKKEIIDGKNIWKQSKVSNS